MPEGLKTPQAAKITEALLRKVYSAGGTFAKFLRENTLTVLNS